MPLISLWFISRLLLVRQDSVGILWAEDLCLLAQFGVLFGGEQVIPEGDGHALVSRVRRVEAVHLGDEVLRDVVPQIRVLHKRHDDGCKVLLGGIGLLLGHGVVDPPGDFGDAVVELGGVEAHVPAGLLALHGAGTLHPDEPLGGQASVVSVDEPMRLAGIRQLHQYDESSRDPFSEPL